MPYYKIRFEKAGPVQPEEKRDLSGRINALNAWGEEFSYVYSAKGETRREFTESTINLVKKVLAADCYLSASLCQGYGLEIEVDIGHHVAHNRWPRNQD